MREISYHPEGIRKLIRRVNERLKRARDRRNGGGGELFANQAYYARDARMADLHLRMLKGVLAETLGKPVEELSADDFEVVGFVFNCSPQVVAKG